MNKKIFLLLFSVLLLTSAVSELSSQACNCFPGWRYRMTITISNNNASAYTLFEVRDSLNTQVLVAAGKMKADGGDIRFADSLCTPLNYFVESGINTNATKIWIRVPSLPANGSRTIYLYYGNPAAVTQSNANSTFSFYEGFDANNLGRFSDAGCGVGTAVFASGVATFSWSASNMWISDSTYAPGVVYTAEANVTAASGSWPGLYWARSTGLQSMAVLMGGSNVRISKTPIGGVGYCNGHNFVPPTNPVITPIGIWSFTWIATGSQQASFPNYSPWSTADSELPRDQPLRICLGGISSGVGSYSVDWVRARKYAPFTPIAANGIEATAPNSPGNSLTATVLGSSSIRINWADSSGNEDKFFVERSTNSGVNWLLRDSVALNITQYIDVGLTQNTNYCYRVRAYNCIGYSSYSNQACATTTFIGITNTGSEIPKTFGLFQNYPNPFNPLTNIKFDIPKASFVKLTIYNALGQTVTEVVNTQLEAGSYTVDWNASIYASGIYFYRIEAGREFIKEMKMVLVK